MRRKDKQITESQELEAILKQNKICRLALSENNIPSIIPMNYGYQDNVLYFHSAKEGRKLEIIKMNPFVCFEITENIEIIESNIACNYGTKYKSVIGNGKIEFINEFTEKVNSLNIIMQQHKKSNNEWEFSKQSVNNIVVFKLKINNITGKQSG